MWKILPLFAFYLPFQIALNPAEGFDLASSRVLIILVFLLWIFESLRKKNFKIKGGWSAFFVSTFLFWSALSLFFAQNQEWSLRKLAFLFSVFPLYFVSSALLDTREKILKTSRFIVAGSFLVALLGVIQFFSQFLFGLEAVYSFWAKTLTPPFLGNNFHQTVMEYPSWLVGVGGKTFLRATSVFPDPHMLAFFCGLTLPLSLGIFFLERKKVFLISAGIIFLSALLTFSRGGYLGILVGVFFSTFFFWGKLTLKRKISIGAVSSFAIFSVLIPGPFSERFFSTFDLAEGSNSGRMIMWQKSWGVFKEKPFFGVGIGNFPLEVKASADYREPIYAHNVYLDIVAESGIFALISWVFFLLSLIYGFVSFFKKDAFFVFPAISVVIFSAHSFFEMPLYSPVVLGTFLLIASFSSFSNKKCLN